MRMICRLLLFLFVSLGYAQEPHLLKSEGREKIINFEFLPDNDYDLEQLLVKDNTDFIQYDSLKKNTEHQSYWVRLSIYNSSVYALRSNLFVFPHIDNTIYYFDHDSGEWEKFRNGLLVPTKKRNYAALPCVFKGRDTSFVYLKVNNKASASAFTPSIFIEKWDVTESREKYLFIVWIITAVSILLFWGYNVIVYFQMRDNITLYYLLILFASLLYVTAHKGFFNYLFEWRFTYFRVFSDSFYYYFDFNTLMNRISSLMVIFGFFQLTKIFLQTKTMLPGIHRLLNGWLIVYLLFTGLNSFFTATNIYPTDFYVNSIHNVFVIISLMLLFFAGIKSYRLNYRPAKYFLAANALPLLLLILLALYFFVFKYHGPGVELLPNLTVLSLILTFAVAMYGRFNILKEELKLKELEAITLKSEKEKIQLKNHMIELEAEQMQSEMALEKAKAENLELQIQINQRELLSSALNIKQKSKALNELRTYTEKINRDLNDDEKAALSKIKSILLNNQILDSTWETFRFHFEKVHPDFFKNLFSAHPNLTPNEVRLCAYLHINLSVKEVASLQNVDPASVRKAKTRLNKKIRANELAGNSKIFINNLKTDTQD
jgi:hypothetical protein